MHCINEKNTLLSSEQSSKQATLSHFITQVLGVVVYSKASVSERVLKK